MALVAFVNRNRTGKWGQRKRGTFPDLDLPLFSGCLQCELFAFSFHDCMSAGDPLETMWLKSQRIYYRFVGERGGGERRMWISAEEAQVK